MKNHTRSLALFALALLASFQASAQVNDTATLKTLKDDEVLVIDRLRRAPGRLEVTTDSVGRARFEIEATIDEDEAISEARIRVWPEGHETPQLDGTAKVIGKYLFWGHTGEDPGMMEVPPDTLIYVPPSATAMEQTVRHAVAVRGDRDTVALTVWSPYKKTEVADANVRFLEPGTVELSLFGATYTLSIDSEGNLLEGSVEPQGNTIVRE